MNATYDDVEGRWKAAQLGNLIADKSKYEAMFHSRVAEKLLAARYALRKTKQDFEMSIFTEEEIRVFCKRTAQINKLEETHRSELQKRTDAIVRAGAKRGVLIDYDSTYQAELAKMSAELREAKRMARLEGAALEKIGLPLEEDWRSQFAPDRVARFTIAASKETSWLPRPTAKHVSQWRACRSFTGAAANRSNQGPIPRLRANDPLPHRAGACNQNRPSLNQWEKYEKEPNRHRWHKLCANLCSACRGHRGKNSLA